MADRTNHIALDGHEASSVAQGGARLLRGGQPPLQVRHQRRGSLLCSPQLIPFLRDGGQAAQHSVLRRASPAAGGREGKSRCDRGQCTPASFVAMKAGTWRCAAEITECGGGGRQTWPHWSRMRCVTTEVGGGGEQTPSQVKEFIFHPGCAACRPETRHPSAKVPETSQWHTTTQPSPTSSQAFLRPPRVGGKAYGQVFHRGGGGGMAK